MEFTQEDFNKAETSIKADRLILKIDEIIDLFQYLSYNKKYMLNKHVASLFSMLNETKATK